MAAIHFILFCVRLLILHNPCDGPRERPPQAAPKGTQKLSGKRTGSGRNSGKSMGTPMGQPARVAGNLSGIRYRGTATHNVRFAVPFVFVLLCRLIPMRHRERMILMEKITPLYQTHLVEGGKMVPFAGYLLPVQYPTGVIAEHMAVRTACGLFDVSHMGEFVFRGEGALATLNHLLTNDFTNMAAGRVRYTAMCLSDGGTVDDLVIYKFADDCYLAVVNAANRGKDYAHMAANLLADTEIEDISDNVAQLALQGPNAKEILAHLIDPELLPQKYYTAVREVILAGIPCMISRTGYTGEFGYELYTAADDAPRLWKLLRDVGKEHGLIPCGLGARDTLRLEAAMPLYGHEMDEAVTPLEAGLDFAVKLQKPEFIGRDALLAAGAPKRVRVGLKATGRGILREEQDVYCDGVKIGRTTSGTFAPYLKQAIAMALVDAAHTTVGTAVEVDVRGRRVPAEIVPLPFYKRG